MLTSSIGFTQNSLIKSGTNLLKVGNNLITIPFNQYSMTFDGVDEYVNIDNVRTALASTTKGTWSCWVKPVSATGSAQAIIVFGDTDAITDFWFNIQTDGVLRAFVRINGTIQWNLDTDNAVFSDNTWTHVAIVHNSISPVLYVNGIVVAQTFVTTTNKTRWFNDANDLDNGRIGCENFNNNGNTNFFNGKLDEPRFWNRDLSADEILDDYNNGAPKKPLKTGLISNFRMGDRDTFDGSNWTLIDNTGNNNGASVNMEFIDRTHDIPK